MNKLEVEISDADMEAAGWVRKEPKGDGKPAINQKYYLLDANGNPSNDIWDNDDVDNQRFLMGNVYLSQESCKLARNRILATHRVTRKLTELRAAEDKCCDWESYDSEKWQFALNHNTKKIQFMYNRFMQETNSEFYSSEAACKWVADNMKYDVWLMITGERLI